MKDRWQLELAELRDVVTVHTVAVHDTDHPKLLNLGEIFEDQEGVLVRLTHLRDETSTGFCRDFFHNIAVFGRAGF